MNKEKYIRWIKDEIKRYQGGGTRDAAREDELQKMLRFIQSETEEQKASDCECCNEFNEWLETLSNFEYPHVFYSKIIIVGLIKGHEKGETNTRKFPLRYCPQCGRKVDGGHHGL